MGDKAPLPSSSRTLARADVFAPYSPDPPAILRLGHRRQRRDTASRCRVARRSRLFISMRDLAALTTGLTGAPD